MPQEATLIRIHHREQHWAGVVLSAAAGLGVGLLTGLVVGELLGDVDGERVRRAVRRLRPAAAPLADPDDVERAVQAALTEHPATRSLAVEARAVGNGIVELTGRAPDDAARQLAADVARGVDAVEVVVNRILVGESDAPQRRANPPSAS